MSALREIEFRDALREAMTEEMRRDQRVFLLGEEVAQYNGAYKVSKGLLEEFGEMRVVDTPITELGFAGVGVGAAMVGLRPVVEFMTWNFGMQAIDQIINSAAKTLYMSGGQMGCPIVFRGPNGAAARVAAQHSQDFAPWYASVPGVIVIAPYSAADAKGLLKAAIRNANPVCFMENEILYGKSFPVPKLDDFVLPIGKARICRPGNDVTIVAYSITVGQALDAAEKLAGQGIDAEVIDLRTLRPLDMDTVIASVKKTNRIVTVEQAWPVCSVGSEVCARVALDAFDYLDAPPTKVAGKDVPMPYAANLEAMALPQVQDIVDAAKARHVLAITRAAGVMIGRAAHGAPWIFREVNELLTTGVAPPPLSRAALRAIVLGHLQAIYAFHGEDSGLRIARKHLGWYGRLLTHAPDARAQCMAPDSTAAQFAVAERLFDDWVERADAARRDTARQVAC